MSQVIELQEAMLAELRHPGSALAACIVVTPVGDRGSLAGHAAIFSRNRTVAHAAATRAGTMGETDQIEVVRQFDSHSGLLSAAREAIAEASAINQPCSGKNAGSARVTAMEHVLLTITGQIDWRQRAPSANEDVPGEAQYDTPSNLSDDILKMLPGCSFSVSRSCR
ncbi:MAG: hypothetical protein ABI227_05545 [Rhodanobacter sp.]